MLHTAPCLRVSRRPRWWPPLVALLLLGACGGGRFAAVSPEDLPELQERVSQQPNNGDLVLRLSAALFAAGRCDTAMTVARTGMRLAPGNAVGPLVVGQCLERAARPDEAELVYERFLTDYPEARGVGAVRARQMLAARSAATETARQALAREAELADQPADPQTVAVLPLTISGDSTYAPLSRGLAQILISDLNLLQRFRMVERLQIGALLDELDLARTARVDPATAARVGRLAQAGRLVQGLANIPDEANVRLEASVVQSSGEVSAPEAVTGRFRDLLRMEKDLVVALASRMGYQLSEAERTLILQNGTQNLAAFLAYSRGLVAEDLGDYSAAAAHYGEAARRDPGFRAARQSYQGAQTTPQVQQAAAGQVTTMAAQNPPVPALPPTEPVLGATIGDLAPTVSEQTAAGTGGTEGGESGTVVTTTAVVTTTSNPPPPTTTPPATVTATIRILFRLP